MRIDATNALLLYNNRAPEAKPLADELALRLRTRHAPQPLEQPPATVASIRPSVIVTVGGDGTILRAAHLAAPLGVPLLGVNMGRLGFLTEVEASDALAEVPRYLFEEGYAWIEPRAMVSATVLVGGQPKHAPVHALNEAVVGRGSVAHIARIAVSVDNVELTTYGADAVIVSTATGSTAYALSAGGPIVYPTSKDMIVAAVAPHGDLSAPVVLPQTATVDIRVLGEQAASLSVDGYWEEPVHEGEVVRVAACPHVAQFLRSGPLTKFYETLVYRLRRGADQARAIAQRMSQHEARSHG